MTPAIECFALKSPDGTLVINSTFKTEYEIIAHGSKLVGNVLWREMEERGYRIVKVSIREVEE